MSPGTLVGWGGGGGEWGWGWRRDKSWSVFPCGGWVARRGWGSSSPGSALEELSSPQRGCLTSLSLSLLSGAIDTCPAAPCKLRKAGRKSLTVASVWTRGVVAPPLSHPAQTQLTISVTTLNSCHIFFSPDKVLGIPG